MNVGLFVSCLLYVSGMLCICVDYASYALILAIIDYGSEIWVRRDWILDQILHGIPAIPSWTYPTGYTQLDIKDWTRLDQTGIPVIGILIYWSI